MESVQMHLTNIFSDTSTNSEKLVSHQFLVSFKDQFDNPYCVAPLLAPETSVNHKVFGFQCLEYYVIHSWNNLPQPSKLEFKQFLDQLIASSLCCSDHIVIEALGKVVVELVKREWPQQWDSLISELESHTKQNPLLGLSVILRLMEDVLEFQTLPVNRRKDILSGINANINVIFNIVFACLVEHVRECIRLSSQGENWSYNVKICKFALESIAVLVDLLSLELISQSDGLLLTSLVQLLALEPLCYESSETILLLFERKLKLLDGAAFRNMVLVAKVLESVESCFTMLSVRSVPTSFEDNFSQRLAQIVVSLTQAFINVYKNTSYPGDLANAVMKLVYYLMTHPSKAINVSVFKLLLQILREAELVKVINLELHLTFILQTSYRLMLKDGAPSDTSSLTCFYSRLQFDSDEEYFLFCSFIRCCTQNVVIQITEMFPSQAMACLASFVSSLLNKTSSASLDGSMRDPRHPLVLEWDALSTFADGVLSTVSKNTSLCSSSDTNVVGGVNLLESLIAFSLPEPLIESNIFSLISSLLPFCLQMNDLVLKALQRVLTSLKFDLPGENLRTRCKAARNMRRHAVACLINMSRSAIILPVLDEYYAEVKRTCNIPDNSLSAFEKSALVESIITLSNSVTDKQKRYFLVDDILSSIRSLWLSSELTNAVSNPSAFVSFLGLDTDGTDESIGIRRHQVSFCCMVLEVVTRKCQAPDTQSPNPGSQTVQLCLENMIRLLNCINLLKTVESKFHPVYSGVLNLTEQQRMQIVGMTFTGSSLSNTHQLDRMRSFLCETRLHCFHFLSHCPNICDEYFFTNSLLYEHLVATSSAQLPNHELYLFLRTLVIPLVKIVSAQHFSKLLSVLQVCLGSAMQRLRDAWPMAHRINNNEAESEDTDTDQLSDEVFEAQLLAKLTRTVVDVMVALLTKTDKEGIENGDTNEQAGKSTTISQMGESTLQVMGCDLLGFLYEVMCWPDSVGCTRASVWALAVTERCRDYIQDPSKMFISVLSGLRVQGSDNIGASSCLAQLFLRLFEWYGQDCLWPQLAVWTGTNEVDWSQFYSQLQVTTGKKALSDKKKKEVVRDLLRHVIGKPLSQQFKEDIAFKALPPLFKSSWRSKRMDMLGEEDTVGLVALFDGAD